MSGRTPQASRMASTRARDHARRIEAIEIDARGHHRDALPRRAVAVVHQLRDLLARPPRPGRRAPSRRCSTCLNRFCSRKPLYQLVTSGMLRRRAAIDALQAAARPSAWIDLAAALAREPRQAPRIAQHGERVVADVERDEFAAGGAHVGGEPPGARHHDGAVAG